MKYWILALSLLINSQTNFAYEAWPLESDPTIMSSRFKTEFKMLPLSGRAAGKTKYWSGDYWPIKLGNINYRWNSPKREGFDLKSPNKASAMKMSEAELATLSPTEKFDLFNGNYNYPLRKEVEAVSNKDAQQWEGICHGWAAAALNHSEPKPKVKTNPDGIKIPFGSADIKALLSYYYANYHEVDNTYQIGVRCFRAGILNRNTYCKSDLNAGSFHIILTNKIGIRKQGLLGDLDRFREVWNHPIFAYESVIEKNNLKPEGKVAPGTVKQVLVRTDMHYVNEAENFWEPIVGTQDQMVDTKNYEYLLDLDKNGAVIGGTWISSDRPDFLWLMEKAREFEAPFTRLSELLND